MHFPQVKFDVPNKKFEGIWFWHVHMYDFFTRVFHTDLSASARLAWLGRFKSLAEQLKKQQFATLSVNSRS